MRVRPLSRVSLERADLDRPPALVDEDAVALAEDLDRADARARTAEDVLGEDRQRRRRGVGGGDRRDEARHVDIRRARRHTRRLGVGAAALEAAVCLDHSRLRGERRVELAVQLFESAHSCSECLLRQERRHRRPHGGDVWESRTFVGENRRCSSAAVVLASVAQRQRRSHGCPRRHQRLRADRPRRIPGRVRVRRRHRVGGDQRRRRYRDARAPAQVRHRLRTIRRNRRAGRGRARRRRDPDRDADRERSRRAAVGRARRRGRHRVERPLPSPRRRREAPRGRSEEGDRLRARQGARCHGRARRQLRDLRPRATPDHLERVVHDELPRARREGPARGARHPARAS